MKLENLSLPAPLRDELSRAEANNDPQGVERITRSPEFTKSVVDSAKQEAESYAAECRAKGKPLSATVAYFYAMVVKVMHDALGLRMRVRMKALEARIEALESRPALKYEGVWEERQYSAGAFVTHSGSVWYCRELASAADVPNASRRWVLAVKRGRDGRGS